MKMKVGQMKVMNVAVAYGSHGRGHKWRDGELNGDVHGGKFARNHHPKSLEKKVDREEDEAPHLLEP
ncbi:hypothetical protein RYX36_035243 [Vicia faba]